MSLLDNTGRPGTDTGSPNNSKGPTGPLSSEPLSSESKSTTIASDSEKNTATLRFPKVARSSARPAQGRRRGIKQRARAFQEAVINRDRKCMNPKCKYHKNPDRSRLTAHHIRGRQYWGLKDGITYCWACHAMCHHGFWEKDAQGRKTEFVAKHRFDMRNIKAAVERGEGAPEWGEIYEDECL